jgi:hypothetical protein
MTCAYYLHTIMQWFNCWAQMGISDHWQCIRLSIYHIVHCTLDSEVVTKLFLHESCSRVQYSNRIKRVSGEPGDRVSPDFHYFIHRYINCDIQYLHLPRFHTMFVYNYHVGEKIGGHFPAGFPWPCRPSIGHNIPNQIALWAEARRLSGMIMVQYCMYNANWYRRAVSFLRYV